jgi:YD repeat-containing protein
VKFFNVVATPGLGQRNNPLKESKVAFGQAQLSINANPLNGNLNICDFTHSYIGQGFEVAIGYQYNSQANEPWRLTQGKIIGSIQGKANDIGSFVLVEESDGHESTYTYDETRHCYVNVSEAGGSSTLTYQEGRWQGWNLVSNINESYNHNNQLETLTDTFGNELSYEYDDKSRLAFIKAQSGLTLAIEYDSYATKIYSLDNDKKTLVAHYEFDNDKHLKKTTIQHPQLGRNISTI